RGADINALDNTKSSPLHLAAFSGQKEMAKYLSSQRCVDFALQNGQGLTAEQAAVYNGQDSISTLLKSAAKLRSHEVSLGGGEQMHVPNGSVQGDPAHLPNLNSTILL